MRFEFVRMRPGDHMAWAFAGPREFAALAASCLMEGAALGERLMYVADQPDPSAVAALSGVVGPDDLRVVSIGDVYGTRGVVDPQEQLACFAAELEAAIAAGYSGLRVVADNTSLVSSEAGLTAWRRYELLADQYAAARPATALCAFDARRLDAARLAELAVLHPLSSASGPVPPFRLFFADRTLWLTGLVTAASVHSLRRALAALPAGTPAALDLGAAGPERGSGVCRGVVTILHELARDGAPVTVLGPAAVLQELKTAFPPAGPGLALQEY